MTQQRRLISFDWAIKRILRSRANFEILEGFLSELLFEDIKILEILESESNKDEQTDKFNRLDIKVKNQKGEIILIEIQYDREMDYLQRVLYASSKAIVEHLKESQSYSQVVKIISISILYFGNGDDYIYKGTTNFIGIHNKSLLHLNEKQKELYKTDTIEKLYPEFYLIQIKNFNDKAQDTLDEWINFLKNETIPEKPKAKGLAKAKETLDYFKMDDSERVEYEKYLSNLHDQASAFEGTYVVGKMDGIKEGVKQGLKKGLEQGMQQGIEQEKLSIAKNLLDILDNETIAMKTGLSINTIQNLR